MDEESWSRDCKERRINKVGNERKYIPGRGNSKCRTLRQGHVQQVQTRAMS